MFRLELANITKPGRLVAIASLLATSSMVANAQTTPSSSSGFKLPAAASPPSTVSALQRGQTEINQAREQLARQDYAAAVETYRRLAPLAQASPQLKADADQLRGFLLQIGIDAALLDLPSGPASKTSQPLSANSGLNRLPPVIKAEPLAPPTTQDPQQAAKAEVLRLTAIGRAALDRGDIPTALRVSRQAQGLRVPETMFAPGEPRAWQLALDAESAAKRAGISLDSGIAQAGFAAAADAPGAVTPSWFGGKAADPASVAPVQFSESVAPPEGPDAFSAAMKLLSEGDRAGARKKFVEAWKFKDQLTPTQQSQVQDKLTLLQPRQLVPSQKSPGELTAIEKTQLESEAATRRLYREVTAEIAKAEQKRSEAPLDALSDLERLRRRVDGSSVDDKAKRSLAVLVDRQIKSQVSYNEANRAQIELDIQNQSVRDELARDQAREAAADEEISTLVDEFDGLMRDRRFEEAEHVAKLVARIKPDSAIATQMISQSRTRIRQRLNDEIRAEKEESYIRNMLDAERSMIGPDPDRPFTLPDAETWRQISDLRLRDRDRDSSLSDAENRIKQQLETRVQVRFSRQPLAEAMDQLASITGIPIVLDDGALQSVGVNADTPISLSVPNPIPLSSALNLMFKNLGLAYMIENDVLNVTTKEVKESNVRSKVYRVTDLVTPIPNFTQAYDNGLSGALRAAYQWTQPQSDVQIVPVSATGLNNLHSQRGGGLPQGLGASPNILGQFNPLGSSGSLGSSSSQGIGGGGGAFADFTSLIDLIQTTVNPDTWDALGGPSTIREYPQNLSLVISTTSETHDDIQALLDSLRRLQNLQITIEVRFITLSDTFAEQIGVDFDFQVDDNTQSLPDEDEGESVTIGFNGAGFTPDLDISFNNTSFELGLPAFGGANLGNPSSIGFAVLSDIEAFFFLQAIQTDNRTNVMQAPRVTLFDGQFASINDQSQSPFVTSVTPVVGDFAVAQQPIIVVLNEGTSMNVQGVVSDDKRFVRLTLVPFFSQIGDVDTFTFEGGETTSTASVDQEDTNGDGVVDENDASDTETAATSTGGTTVQLPTFAFTQVQTTVSVPDGGTILLGGIKRLSEARAERGVPILSKIPYVSRLFRNVVVGRDAQSLMLMVTPRIIIEEEEELAQTGFNKDAQ